jgi:hypothetical protein
MNVAMSDDFASLVLTGVFAVLAVGTVQIGSLQRELVARSVEVVQRESRVVQALRDGRTPDEDDVSWLSRVPPLTHRSVWATLALFVWVILCGVNAVTAMEVLRWSAIDGHGKDPQLAAQCLGVLYSSIFVLVTEGVARMVVKVLSGGASERRALGAFHPGEGTELRQVLRHYRRTGTVPPLAQRDPDPDTQNGP